MAGVILILMWLALDDITTGSEASYTTEWLMVGGGLAALAGIVWCGVKK